MAKTAIEKAIFNKVKEQLGLDYSNFEEFKKAFFTFSEEDRKKIREIVRNLTILDPAVGSGHFLVSSLNVLLEIWYELGMINIPKKYEVKFENGDIKLYKNDKPFVYRKNSSVDDADFQQKVFKAKKEIIENNLFGVDINPKAVEIARLRLWIELLKNAYYKPDGTMETLPNIDINIKVGDSLRAPIVDISTTLFNKRIPRLKELFTEYQNTSNKVERKAIAEEFGNIRKEIITGIETAYNDLIWTLDFPHTIDENGQFKGFDVVIGNPPYIDSESMSKTQPEVREYLSREYDMAKGNWDIFVVFIEKGISLLKDNGMLSYIVPNKLISAPYSETLRKYLLTKKVIEIRDLSNINVFEEADVYPIVIIIQNSSIRNDVLVTTMQSTTKIKEQNIIAAEVSMQSTTKIKEQNIIAAEVFYQDIYWDKYFINSVQLALLIKISKFPSLETYAFNISNAATVNEAYKIKEYLQEEGNLTGVQFSKFINTGTISRYVSLWGIKPTTYIKSTYRKPVISYKDLQNIS